MSLHQAYDSSVRPTISQMQGMGPAMDSMGMSMMGGAGSATGHCIHNCDGSYTLQP